MFIDTDASLVEINPLVLTSQGTLMAIDVSGEPGGGEAPDPKRGSTDATAFTPCKACLYRAVKAVASEL